MRIHDLLFCRTLLAIGLAFGPMVCLSAEQPESMAHEIDSLRLAIEDLVKTFGDRYPLGAEYLARLKTIQAAGGTRIGTRSAQLGQLKQEALLANPLWNFDRLVVLKRKRGQLGLPTNHQCNSCLDQSGYDNEIAMLSPPRPDGKLTTLFRPKDGAYVGELDLHYDGNRLLFSMPNGRTWQIHEMGIDGRGLHQVSREEPDVDNFDPCYLPDGGMVFASTASFTGVPCWHGKERACCLYRMNADGTGVRQLCFDQDLDLHPSVLSSGQIIYSRWDYTGIMHIYLRPLMVMNPDGTLQRAVYGTNSYYPNALYFPREIPGSPNKLAVILSGYHGVNRAGELVVLDTSRGWHEADGIVHRIMHRDEPIVPVVRDNLVGNSWPKFLHPYPLSEKYFLAAAQPRAKSPWGIYLVDVFDNMVPLQVDRRFDFFEPIPVKTVPKPPVLPNRVDLSRSDAVVYLHDVYAGPGLAGVPRGSVKRLRIVAYRFGYPGMAGPDKVGRAGPWDVMRILGTVPVYPDGSVLFRVPANTPLSVQPLDSEGKALQLMRSWYTAMPGEAVSCVGCHERPPDTPLLRTGLAATYPPSEIEPWYGPARGFDFEREVQPVLDKYCVECHNERKSSNGEQIADLRSVRLVKDYQGLPLSKLGADRLEPELRKQFPSYTPAIELIGDIRMKYTPAYDALTPFIRRVNIEDSVRLHVAAEYHADTSELVQMLQKGHHGVQLDREAWDRLITWIDLNGPCHGTWGDVCAIPNAADVRRAELAHRFGGLRISGKHEPKLAHAPAKPVKPVKPAKPVIIAQETENDLRTPPCPGWPFGIDEAHRRQRASSPWQRTLELANGVSLKLVRIPAGTFLMGAAKGEVDAEPLNRVTIKHDFWMGACEITNEQFQQFDPQHDSGLFTKRSLDANGPGIAMNDAQQPVVRVSWEQAMAFCRWLSETTGLPFTLPTEAQWEYACRAGQATPLSYGDLDADFSGFGNFADEAISRLYTVTGGVVVLQEIPSDKRFNDGAVATTDVGRYRPNPWGLLDMHGNAAEWTRSTFAPYPYRETDGRNSTVSGTRKTVRGGSFYDRPKRCRSAFRLSYPAWQRVHNVGFRVVCEVREHVAAR